MSGGLELYAVLVFIYLVDCFLWASNQAVVFSSYWPGKFNISSGGILFKNTRGSLLPLNPLPPLGRVFLCQVPPISISLTGVCNYNIQTISSYKDRSDQDIYIAYNDIQEISVHERWVLINKLKFIKCETRQRANDYVELIKKLKQSGNNERRKNLEEHLNALFDIDKARIVLNRFQVAISILPIVCNLYFIILFLIIPIAFRLIRLQSLIFPILVIIIYFSSIISILYWLAHKELYPNQKPERINTIIGLVLCPPMTIRAIDKLSLYILSSFDPLVLTKIFPSPASILFGDSYIRDLKYPLKYSFSSEESENTCKWYNNKILERSIVFIGYKETHFPQMPGLYCPRCLCYYNVSNGDCPDCPGVKLVHSEKGLINE